MDYFDADVAYLVGLIVARGQLVEQSDERRIIIEFPGSTMQVEGIDSAFDQPTEIKLGLVDIAFRLRNLLETDIDIHDSGQGTHRLLVRFHRNKWQSWDIQVDIVGFIRGRSSVEMVLVECKNKPITLAHLSQVIGYCRVVNPIVGMLLSPCGVSNSLKRLIEVYGRQDVLIYSEPARQSARRIILARWDPQGCLPEPSSIIPPGSLG